MNIHVFTGFIIGIVLLDLIAAIAPDHNIPKVDCPKKVIISKTIRDVTKNHTFCDINKNIGYRR